MAYEKKLVDHKLHSWENYFRDFRLPDWREIPDFGLYMEQVLSLINSYLDYVPRELRAEQLLTAATINNYVRKKIMPEPVKKKYYRVHIAYLVMIYTLRQTLSMTTLTLMIPSGLSAEEFRPIYEAYVKRYQLTAGHFMKEVREAAAGIIGEEMSGELATDDPRDLIISSVVISGFARLLAERLLLLDGRTMEGEAERNRED